MVVIEEFEMVPGSNQSSVTRQIRSDGPAGLVDQSAEGLGTQRGLEAHKVYRSKFQKLGPKGFKAYGIRIWPSLLHGSKDIFVCSRGEIFVVIL